jgi:hypothetical protein
VNNTIVAPICPPVRTVAVVVLTHLSRIEMCYFSEYVEN